MSGRPQKLLGVDIKNEILTAMIKGEDMKTLASRLGVRHQTLQYYRKKFRMPRLKAWKYEEPCEVDGCWGKVHGNGLCNLHYKRKMINGDPLLMRRRENGSGTPHSDGYWVFKINGITKCRHIGIAEKVLGKTLPKGAEVHHFNGDRSNDSNSNLVICQDRKYHKLLEKRYRELKEKRNVLHISPSH